MHLWLFHLVLIESCTFTCRCALRSSQNSVKLAIIDHNVRIYQSVLPYLGMLATAHALV